MNRTKPAYTFAQHKAAIPDTKHTHLTYCAAQFGHHEVKLKNPKVGDEFFNETDWRIVVINATWIYAVPVAYVDNYWE
jgi:hypothetical protein